MLKMYSPTYQAAMMADQGRTQRMPFYMCMPAMCMATATSTTLLGTGVVTSVSLFVAAISLLIALLILVGLVVLISLILTGLTGLVGLGSLVGLTTVLATTIIQATQGE
jgi:uncharacterized membrane protein YhaH (DUF805 family)